MSGKAIPLTNHYTLDELESYAKKCKDTKVFRRLTAIIAIKNGRSRAEAAELGKMSTDALCYWVKRFNEFGFDRLYNKKASGRPPILNAAEQAEFFNIVQAGPEPETDGINRWRLCDLVQIIVKTFGVKLGIATVWRILKCGGFTTQSPRPRHPKQNPEDIVAFKRDFGQLVKDLTAHVPADKTIRVWFQDEAKIGEKNNRAKIWSRVGERPIVPADMGYQVGFLMGAICPELGQAVGLIMPVANTVTTQMLLECISAEITDQEHGVIIMDRATWHTTKKLKIPANMTIIFLPPYCPELNPIEQVWDFLRKNYLSNRIYNTWDALEEAIWRAWDQLRQSPEQIKKIGSRKWAVLNLHAI